MSLEITRPKFNFFSTERDTITSIRNRKDPLVLGIAKINPKAFLRA